jgi:hypothetical protein
VRRADETFNRLRLQKYRLQQDIGRLERELKMQLDKLRED